METQISYPSFYELTNSLLDPASRFSSNALPSTDMTSLSLVFSTTSLDDETKLFSYSTDEPVYEPTRVILFKKIPYDATELDVLEICSPFGIVSDIYLMKAKGYCFVQFQNLKSATSCWETFRKSEPRVKGSVVFIFYTGKKEIYKPEGLVRPPNRFIMLVFNTNETVTKQLTTRILISYGKILQLNIFDTKPQSAYIEMDDVGSAISAKESLNETIYQNTIKIQTAYISQKIFDQSTNFGHFNSMPLLVNSNNFDDMSMNAFYSNSVENFEDVERVEKQIDMLQRESNKSNEKNQNTVMIKNLPKGISCYQLFKLFGMYGNVMKIKIFFSNPENALIEFQDNSQAVLAKTHLNNCPIFGSNVFVTLSKNSIVFNTPFIPENNRFLADYSDSKEHRYKIAGSKNFRNIAPPSPVLHLSNLCEDKDEEYYRELFSECGMVKKFLPLKGETRTLLMEMENVGQSVAVLINFHNYNIDGKFLKVSFSKYHMIKE